jgi:hypothetical protein
MMKKKEEKRGRIAHVPNKRRKGREVVISYIS